MKHTNLLLASRSTINESNGREMFGCLETDGVIECFFPGETSAMRNAHLYAAAPELLAALRALVHPMADDEDIETARAAIAKAEGAQ